MRHVTSALRLLLALLTLTLVSAACAVDATPAETTLQRIEAASPNAPAPEFEATADFLARARLRTSNASTLRFEGFTEVNSSFMNMGSRNDPFMSGSVDGLTSETRVDLGSLMGPLLAQTGFGVDPSDLTMTIVTDADAAYLNAPFFATIAAIDPSMTGSDFAWMQDIATGWGRIEVEGLDSGNVFGDLNLGAGSAGTEMLEILEGTGEVLDGGEADVRGVPTRVAHANVTFLDLMESSGQDLGSLGLGRTERSMLEDLSANVAVFVSDDGLVRRIEFTMDFGALADMDPSAAGLEMTMWQRVDFFDFGEPVRISIPTESIDITKEFEDFGG